MARIPVWNETQQTHVCREGELADTSMTRLFGLLGKKSMAEEAGLLIRPSSGVHTWGMSMDIDIVALDGQNVVTGVFTKVGPWKLRGLSRRTKSVLELPAGRTLRARVCVGDQLRVEPL